MPSRSTPPAPRSWMWMLFGLAAAFALGDLTWGPLMRAVPLNRAWIVGVAGMTLLAAQASLLATWGVFGAWRFRWRLVCCAILGLAAWTCFVLGMSAAVPVTVSPREFSGVMVAFLCCLPTMFFSIQAPLWMLRLWLGWKTVQPTASREGSYAALFQVRDIVLAVIAVSFAAAIARLGPTVAHPIIPEDDFFVALLLLAGAAMWGSAITLPALLYAFMSSAPLARRVTWAVLWASAPILLSAVWASVFQPGPPLPRVFATCVAVATFIPAYGGALILARTRGYRLERRASDSMVTPRG